MYCCKPCVPRANKPHVTFIQSHSIRALVLYAVQRQRLYTCETTDCSCCFPLGVSASMVTVYTHSMSHHIHMYNGSKHRDGESEGPWIVSDTKHTFTALVLTSDEGSVNKATRWGKAPASSTAYLPLVITDMLKIGPVFCFYTTLKPPKNCTSFMPNAYYATMQSLETTCDFHIE